MLVKIAIMLVSQGFNLVYSVLTNGHKKVIKLVSDSFIVSAVCSRRRRIFRIIILDYKQLLCQNIPLKIFYKLYIRERVVREGGGGGGATSRFTENKTVFSQFTKNKIGISRFTEKRRKFFLGQRLHTVAN